MDTSAFQIGATYTRADIYDLLAVPPEKRRGNWETGYNKYGDDWFLFVTIGAAGRSGHNYNNHWDGDELIWRGKEGSTLTQPSIQSMLKPTGEICVFVRDNDRPPFTFQGFATAKDSLGTVPVTIRWSFATSRVLVATDDQNDYAIEDRKAEIKQRVKQSVFRERVLANFGYQCCLSDVSERDLLVASHVVPWSVRIDSRLDPSNGLCLFSVYDALFDSGYITFGDDLRVITTTTKVSCQVGNILAELRG
jgi:hypothetical protein